MSIAPRADLRSIAVAVMLSSLSDQAAAVAVTAALAAAVELMREGDFENAVHAVHYAADCVEHIECLDTRARACRLLEAVAITGAELAPEQR